uniref:Uncharacterized protein n=1 Tax=Xenopus tropicalis TaxID=8364 RepID=A0A803JKL6_XENTR
MSTPPGFYADPLDLFARMDYSWTPEIPTDPRERTLFWLRCESLGLSGDEGLAYGVGQLVAGEADLEDGYYVLQRTMHQPGGRYWHSPYTVLPLPCSLAEWHGQWERLNFCDYSTFVGNPEGEFHTLYAQRFFYIGMNDTEERRDWLADLVYQELELIKEYGSIQELENQRKEALRVCAPSFCGFQQAQPCLGTVGPKQKDPKQLVMSQYPHTPVHTHTHPYIPTHTRTYPHTPVHTHCQDLPEETPWSTRMLGA